MQTLPLRTAAVIVGALTLTPLTGCYGTIAKRTEDFSVKAAPALVEARGVYSLIEAVHGCKREQAIALYDTTPFDKVKRVAAMHPGRFTHGHSIETAELS